MTRLTHLLRLLLFLTALCFIGLYIFVALRRLAYPFELEALEGGSLVQIARILKGQPLYVRPSFVFTPLIYTPLYFYTSAALATMLGVSFVPLRFVSFAASLISMALIFVIIRHEGAGRLPAIVGAGLYAATYALTLAWFDIARVDSLFVMWLLLAIYLMRRGTRGSFVLAGLALGLAWFTKQTAIVAIIVLGGYALLAWRRHGLVMISVIIGVIGIGSLIWNASSAGWFNYYVFYLPTTHELALSLRTAIGFLFVDGLLVLPVVCCFGLWWFLWQHQSNFRFGTRLYYMVAAAALVSLSFLARINTGAARNSLMPEFAALAIMLGFGLEAVEHAGAWLAVSKSNWLQAGLYGLILAQFMALLYSPVAMIPTDQDRQAGEQLVNRIRTTLGEVYVQQHGYLALQAGKQPYVPAVSLAELDGTFGTRPVAEWTDVFNQMHTAIKNRAFSLIILDQPGWMQTDLDKYYAVVRQPIFTDEHVFRLVVGWPGRPDIIYAPSP